MHVQSKGTDNKQEAISDKYYKENIFRLTFKRDLNDKETAQQKIRKTHQLREQLVQSALVRKALFEEQKCVQV